MRFPSLAVEKTKQTYTRLDEFTYRYASGTFEAELVVDEDGLVRAVRRVAADGRRRRARGLRAARRGPPGGVIR